LTAHRPAAAAEVNKISSPPAMPLTALRVPTPCVGAVELVTISNPGRLSSVFQLLHQTKIVIARHTENMFDARFLKTTK
jgi:hypothetical protein